MEGIAFKEQTALLAAPRGQKGKVYDLPIKRIQYSDGTPAVISCWQASWKERLAILFTGRVWFFCFGHTHPPILLKGEKTEEVTAS